MNVNNIGDRISDYISRHIDMSVYRPAWYSVVTSIWFYLINSIFNTTSEYNLDSLRDSVRNLIESSYESK
jgi:hypothetical protein